MRAPVCEKEIDLDFFGTLSHVCYIGVLFAINRRLGESRIGIISENGKEHKKEKNEKLGFIWINIIAIQKSYD